MLASSALRMKIPGSWFDEITTSGFNPLILSLSKDEPTMFIF